MVRPLIYDKGFHGNIIGDVDRSIKDRLISQLSDDHIFVNTTWIERDLELERILSKDKIVICYSGPDWENSCCIDIRRQAHSLIIENSKQVKHIGNTRGLYYFNYWAEFIRQNPQGFFDESYLSDPVFDKVYMCLNRKPHDHRIFLVEKLKENRLLDIGIVSLGVENPMIIDESLPEVVELGEDAVAGKMPIKNDIVSLGDQRNWNRHFINVVTETTIHTDVFISEKTWKPIIGMRPFLILGDYNIYPQLKDLGFDTFDDVFGVWWDNKNWETRAERIISILKGFDIDSCNRDYKNLFPRLLKNRQRFLEYIIGNQKRIDTLL